MSVPNLSKYLDEMNGAATEPARTEPPSAPAASPGQAPEVWTAENQSYQPLAWLYFLAVLPFFGGVLVAVECRVVFGMYQLLALVGGAVFGRWAFLRRPSVEGVATLEQAWRLVSRTTALLGAVPVAAGLAFLLVELMFGVVWAYAVALVVTFLGVGGVDGQLPTGPTAEAVERGRKQGGVDDKLREEYEKARREHTGQG